MHDIKTSDGKAGKGYVIQETYDERDALEHGDSSPKNWLRSSNLVKQ